MTVLVTGASGFIGRHLCYRLVDEGYRVRGLLRPQSDSSQLSKDVKVSRSELADMPGLVKACEGVTIIFHVAGVAHVGTRSSSEHYETNVEGTRNVLAAGREAGVTRFVFFSSILATQQQSDYGRSKHLAEQLVLENAEHYRSVSILRPVNVYGATMKGNIAGLIKRIKKGSLPPLPLLSNRLSLVSVQDLCEAAILAAESPDSAGQTYPVTDGQSYTPNTLECAIYAALGRKKPGWRCPRVIFYAASLGTHILNSLGVWNNDLGLRTYRNLVESSEVSCEKITAELGYQPSRTFKDELPAIISMLSSK